MTQSSDRPVAITGATGHIGGQVARLLATSGLRQRLVVRDAARAPELPGAEVATVQSYGDDAGMRRALAGIGTLFLVSATESPDRRHQHDTAVDCSVAAGVERIVYLSFFGAAPEATFTFARDHWHTEQHIRRSGLKFTFLRDNMYADFMPHLAGADGVIRGPAGDGQFAPVAQRDVAEVAATILAAAYGHAALGKSPHDGATYDLTGPELVSMRDIAAIISTSTGRDITFHDETVPEAYESRASYHAPDWEVDAWVSTYTAIAAGELAPVSSAVADITGRAPTRLADLFRSDM